MFDRLSIIFTNKQMEKIQKLNVLIIGIGGVGGYALEALVRSGVLNITIIDNDVIELSNLNRQIISLNSNLKNEKVVAAQERMLDINPDIKINAKNIFLNKDNIDSLNMKEYDYIIDACDTITTKVLLAKKAKEEGINIISCMGTGNRFKPELLEITKLSKTYNDPVAKIMRKLLKEEGIYDMIVCWSREVPIKTGQRTPGSAIFVPATAGLLISSHIILETIKDA